MTMSDSRLSRQNDKNLFLLPKMATRHGSSPGHGTGKTVSLQVMAKA